METLLLLTEIAGPKDVKLARSSDLALARWRQLAASTSKSNDDATRVLAYLLAIGLRREDEHACDLVVACFPAVHEALLDGRLGWAEWLWLEPLVPSEYRFFSRDWDKADKLRRALLERFSVQGWAPRRLAEAAYSERARVYLETTARGEHRWEKIAREGIVS